MLNQNRFSILTQALMVASFVVASMLTVSSAVGQRDRGDRGDRGREDRGSSRSERWQRERSTDQSERYMGYIKGMDKNNNGLIEPSEMSGRGQQWIQGMGFQTSRPIRVRDIESKIRRNERDRLRGRAKEEADKNFSNAVPDFMSTEIVSEPIQGFGFENPNQVEVEETSRYTNRYSEAVQKQADDSMRRYDRNQNGTLEADEIKSARWGNPSPSDSDLNKDGRLSRTELMERYKRRENPSSSRSSSNRGSSSRSSSRERLSSSSSNRRTLGSGGSYGTTPRARSGYRSSSSSSSSSSGSSGQDSERLRKYVSNQIDQYDKDNDGKLSKDEMSKMSRAPRNADKDKDGLLDSDEMYAYYSGDTKSSSSSSRTGSRTSSSRSGSSSRSLSGDIGRKLRDNTQIAMGDFADEWTDETFEEFNRLDLNGDGYITREEHANASKSSSSSKGSSRSYGSTSSRTKSYRDSTNKDSSSRGSSSRGSSNRSSRWNRRD